MKNNRFGKAEIFNDDDIKKIRKVFTVPHHRCIFEIALFTGERMSAVCQLKVSDVYRDPINSVPHEQITFPARTRKARPDGTRQTRQVFVNRDLENFLKAYKPPEKGYLFPGGTANGEHEQRHLTRRAVDKYWREQFLKIGLDYRGFSTHSTRRWLINRLHDNGVSIRKIMAITGHKNVKVLLGYIDAKKEQLEGAMNSITV